MCLICAIHVHKSPAIFLFLMNKNVLVFFISTRGWETINYIIVGFCWIIVEWIQPWYTLSIVTFCLNCDNNTNRSPIAAPSSTYFNWGWMKDTNGSTIQYTVIAVFAVLIHKCNRTMQTLQTLSHLLAIPSGPLPSQIHKSSASSVRENVIR